MFLTTSRAEADRLTKWTLRAVLAFALVGVFVAFAMSDQDWEILSTKHYWSQGGYYAGYSLQVAQTPGGYRTLQSEGVSNIHNMWPLTNRQAEGVSNAISGFPGTERLLVPFLAYLVLRVSDGWIDVLTAFWMMNVGIWLLAVVLVHRLAAMFFDDPRSPLIAAAMTAAYPVFALMFGGIKGQHIGSVFLIAGMYLYESRLQYLAKPWQFVQLVALFSLGLFATGGWLFLLAYLLLRQYWRTNSDRWWTVGVVLAAIMAARLALAFLTARYKLPSVETYLDVSYPRMFSESIGWLTTWWQGGDTTKLKLLNYPGQLLFTHLIPNITLGFLRGHWLLLTVAVLAATTLPRVRIFVVLAAVMFVLGHAGMVISGWTWHYGYLSAPAALMLILACGGSIGELSGTSDLRWRVLALVLLCAVLWQFSDQKTHAGLYYGGRAETFGVSAIVHHEGHEPITY
jgi:hypothetical protein